MKKCDCSVPASILNDRREETVPRVVLEWGSDRTSVVAVSTLAHRFSRPSPTPKGHLFAPSVISFVEPPHIQSARRLDLLNGMPPFGPITSDNKTHVIDPGNPGPFRVCSTTSTFTIQDGLNKGKEREFVVFVPGTQTGTKCQPATVDCPLIIVMHADKTGNEYLTYSELGTHLASHGYVVIVVNRNGTPTVGADASFENAILVGSVVSEINNGLLGLNSILNSQTVLIGHSAGGKAVQFAFKAPAQLGRPLDSIILMGSTAEVSTPSFNGSIGSFLGIHVRTDTDASASGGKPILHQAKQTTFLVYENAGVNPGGSSSCGFEKHLLYVG